MKSFTTFLTEDKNTHLEHLEDDIIMNGVAGGDNAISFLESLRDMLAGNTSKKMSLTVKWDGSPAIWAGTNPENGKFFVGGKHIFNKTPKINYTNADIDRNHPGAGLNKKLKVALATFPALNIPGIWQGDLLFGSGDLSSETIDDESMVTFRPNTITYAVPMGSKLEKTISKAKMGVVWHTTYSGDTMEDMTASFGVNPGSFREVNTVWQADASFKDQSGTATMTKRETGEVTAILKKAGSLFQRLDSNILGMIANDPQTSTLVKTYYNTKVRSGEKVKNVRKHTAGMIAYVYDKLKADIDKVKQEKSKKAKKEVMDKYVGFLRKNSSEFVKIFAMQNLLIDAKLLIVRKLESIQGLTKTFIKTSTGYRVTAPEGFVAIDSLKGGAVKLVDRMEFSMQNFNAAKNWDK